MSHCAIAYYRVSKQRQGGSGLGIEAQRARVEQFARAEGFQLIGEHVDVETGKGSDSLDRRPHLAQALAAARQARCPVIVAKLDRLSRDVAFLISPGRRCLDRTRVISNDLLVTTATFHVFACWTSPGSC